MNAAQLTRFARTATTSLVNSWPATIQTATAASIACAKSPSVLSRQADEQGTGYVQRTIATFLIPQAVNFRPDIGAQWTLTATKVVADLNTVWRCFDLTRGESGGPDRCVCFKLD